jgi:hypothetical protein
MTLTLAALITQSKNQQKTNLKTTQTNAFYFKNNTEAGWLPQPRQLVAPSGVVRFAKRRRVFE